jgi:hypothetical protein
MKGGGEHGLAGGIGHGGLDAPHSGEEGLVHGKVGELLLEGMILLEDKKEFHVRTAIVLGDDFGFFLLSSWP